MGCFKARLCQKNGGNRENLEEKKLFGVPSAAPKKLSEKEKLEINRGYFAMSVKAKQSLSIKPIRDKKRLKLLVAI